MRPLPPCVLLSLFLAQPGWLVFAADDPFAIDLTIQADRQQQSAHGRAASAAADRRPVLTAKTGVRLRIRWLVANQEKAGAAIRNVTVHVILDNEAGGRSAAAGPKADAVYESALVTDFAAGAKSSGDFMVEAPEPGSYLLRVETIGAARTRGDEYSAAIGLQVVP